MSYTQHHHQHHQPFEPFSAPIKVDPPNERDIQIDGTLFQYMEKEIRQESEEESIRRSQVLTEVKRIFLDWVKFVAVEVVHLPEEEAIDVGGELFVSGSHKLNVREPGADIDTICVAPNFCLREHFFSSLRERLVSHPDVVNLTSVESAKVPLITFDFRGVNIDLLFARMAENSIPSNINERIFDDEILKNLDEASVMSVNGPRATYMISKLVPHYDNFLTVLRCIRVWAKQRGLYGNKFGYLGGINCNILVAYVCQLYPNASPSTLLHRFFFVYSKWSWPSPIKLNHIKGQIAGDDVRTIWSEDYDYHDKMPMITPSYPAMNSAKSVSDNSLRVMTKEFVRGHDIISRIITEGGVGWDRLFVSSSFFVDYSKYLACHIFSSGVGQDRAREWTGLAQSLMRFFPEHLQQLPLENIHLFPKEFPSNRSNDINSCCYFIGFDIDRSNIRDKEIDIYQCEQEFWDKRLSYFKREPDDAEDAFDFVTEPLKFKTLPDEVFKSLGGRTCAKMMRDFIIAARAKGTITSIPSLLSTNTPSKSTTSSLTTEVASSGLQLNTPKVEKTGSTAKEILTQTLATLLDSATSASKKSGAAAVTGRQSLRKRKLSVDGAASAFHKKSRIIQEIFRHGAAGEKAAVMFPKRTAVLLLPNQNTSSQKNLKQVPSISWNLISK